MVAGRRVAGTRVHAQTKHTGERQRVPVTGPTLVVTNDDAPKDVTPQPPPPERKAPLSIEQRACAIAQLVVGGSTYAAACRAHERSPAYTHYLRRNPDLISDALLRAQFLEVVSLRASATEVGADRVAEALLSGRYANDRAVCIACGMSSTYLSKLRGHPQWIQDDALRQRFCDHLQEPTMQTKPTDPTPSPAIELDDPPMFRKLDFKVDGELQRLRDENDRLRRALAEVTMDLYEARRP